MHKYSQTTPFRQQARASMSRTEVEPIKASFNTHHIYGESHVGAVRSENQDFIGYAHHADRTLLIVVDGMGGHSGGYEASRIATREMKSFFEKSDLPPLALLEKSIEIAHQKILDFAAEDPSFEGMGTTVVCALIESNRVWLAHVGDSRAHLLRERVLYQLTIDHTCVNNIALCGELPYEQIENHKFGHILERSLGSEDPPEIEVQSTPIALVPGDRLILSTDGFWQKGGSDNITIAMMECLSSQYSKEPIQDARDDFKTQVLRAYQSRQEQLTASRKEINSHGLREEYVKDDSLPLPPPPEPAPVLQILLGIAAFLFLIYLLVFFVI